MRGERDEPTLIDLNTRKLLQGIVKTRSVRRGVAIVLCGRRDMEQSAQGCNDVGMQSVARIIDANANRAREALRVMEDAARFALNDGPLTARLKSLRHDLRAALDRLPAGWLEAN